MDQELFPCLLMSRAEDRDYDFIKVVEFYLKRLFTSVKSTVSVEHHHIEIDDDDDASDGGHRILSPVKDLELEYPMKFDATLNGSGLLMTPQLEMAACDAELITWDAMIKSETDSMRNSARIDIEKLKCYLQASRDHLMTKLVREAFGWIYFLPEHQGPLGTFRKHQLTRIMLRMGEIMNILARNTRFDNSIEALDRLSSRRRCMQSFIYSIINQLATGPGTHDLKRLACSTNFERSLINPNLIEHFSSNNIQSTESLNSPIMSDVDRSDSEVTTEKGIICKLNTMPHHTDSQSDDSSLTQTQTEKKVFTDEIYEHNLERSGQDCRFEANISNDIVSSPYHHRAAVPGTHNFENESKMVFFESRDQNDDLDSTSYRFLTMDELDKEDLMSIDTTSRHDGEIVKEIKPIQLSFRNECKSYMNSENMCPSKFENLKNNESNSLEFSSVDFLKVSCKENILEKYSIISETEIPTYTYIVKPCSSGYQPQHSFPNQIELRSIFQKEAFLNS